jgi:hypothetical protein
MVLALNVDRPDPENRPFTHTDPLAWTEAHRPKIVRAFYTLLLAGASKRSKNQMAKSRFKTWWALVGWPMEYAAGLIGLKVDCTELLRAGEAGDEEASAASTALTLLHSLWGTCRFTARDVVRAMTSLPKPDGFSFYPKVDEAEKAKADAIADALGELVGKRLDRPTAHSIGKLFQKRLVGRPAWIGDGQDVAVLKRTPGHSENGYHIDVCRATSQTPSDQTQYTSWPTPDGDEHSPLSPHSPGKDGNVGNVSITTGGDEHQFWHEATV